MLRSTRSMVSLNTRRQPKWHHVCRCVIQPEVHVTLTHREYLRFTMHSLYSLFSFFRLAMPSVRPTMPNFIGQAAVLEGGSEKALIEDVTTRHRKVCCCDNDG
jgi:hypothetical protein